MSFRVRAQVACGACAVGLAAFVLPLAAQSTVSAPATTAPRTTPRVPAPRPASAPGTITNQDVIDLATAGLGDDVILAAIRHATTRNFTVTPAGLIALKKGKVSDAVIREMQGLMTPAGTAAAAAAPVGVPAAPTPTPIPPVPQPEVSVSKPLPATAAIRPKSGTPIRLRTSGGLVSKGMKVGDPVALEVTSDVFVDGQLVVREGTPVAAKATEVVQASLSRFAALTFSIDSVQSASGEIIPLRAGSGADPVTVTVRGGTAKPGTTFLASVKSDTPVSVVGSTSHFPVSQSPAITPGAGRTASGGSSVPPVVGSADTTVARSPRSTDLPDRDTGIYLEQADTLVLLDPTLFSRVNTGSLFKTAWSYGMAKGSQKIVVSSTRAKLRVPASVPSFVFYLERSALGTMSNPGEFALARMDVKGKQRELVVGKTAVVGVGGSEQIQPDRVVEMQIEVVRPGVFRVSPTKPFVAGEYCFFHPLAAKVFDFGVD